MTTMIRNVAVLACVALAACATGGGKVRSVNDRFRQADYRLPEPRAFSDDDERARFGAALQPLQRAEIAHSAGNTDQARAEWGAAADAFAAWADRFPSSEWRITIRYKAADLYFRAGQNERAAMQAEKVLVDPMASDVSKAMAARLAAAAWQNEAIAQTREGKIEPIKLETADARQGRPLKPQPPPVPWKRFVEATDAYTKVSAADPDLKNPPGQRRFSAGPASLALIAAQVEYAADNMEDARGRFEKILQDYANEPEIVDAASTLYLQTFLVLGDDPGFQAAVERVNAMLQAQQAQATDPKAKEQYAKIADNVRRVQQGSGFNEGARLLDAGKFAESGAAFEKFATEYADNPDAPNALFNAAIAYDKAKQSDKAAAVRQKLVDNYPDAKVSATASVMLGQYYSRKNKHADAAKLYTTYLAKWPEGEYRCAALQNVAYEYDVLKKTVEAAQRYLEFGTDPKCANEDPNSAAKSLYRAGQFFENAKQRGKAREAYKAASELQGVTDTVAKSQVQAAKEKLKSGF